MVFEVILNCNSLDELLDSGSADEYPDTFGRKTHIERYRELAKKFAQFPVEMGAMQAAIKEWMDEIQEKSKDINKNENKEDRDREINKLFEDDPIIFLNRHDVSHTKKVMDRALELIKCFNRIDFSCYEIYFLLCAIVVHDVGNIYGRAGHEKKLAEILNNQCDNIIPDAIERRVISRIAGVHGGKIKGSSDTISVLNKTNTVNGFEIKEQLLAAILRFADELADDATRADYDALDNGIIGPASQIYHIYSEKLHTVALQKNKVTNAYEVYLAYQFDSNVAKTLYGKAGHQRYLVDEIYARTIKMERERRYCIRYLRSYCSLERIVVEIVITKDVFDEERISYTLEEKGYPVAPFSSIKDVSTDILSGEELVAKLEGGK